MSARLGGLLGSCNEDGSECTGIGGCSCDSAEEGALATSEVVGTLASREAITETKTSSKRRCESASSQSTLGYGAVTRADLVAIVVESDRRGVNGLTNICCTTGDSVDSA